MARVFITRSSDGLGLAAAQSLLGDGHEVVLHARSKEMADEAQAAGSGAASVVIGDLASQQEARNVAEQVNALGRMDAVIHNAGIYTTPDRGSTPEGHATVLAVNTLAPYILTALIERPGRLVYLSSGLHRGGEGSLADLDWRVRRWDAAKLRGEQTARRRDRRGTGAKMASGPEQRGRSRLGSHEHGRPFGTGRSHDSGHHRIAADGEQEVEQLPLVPLGGESRPACVAHPVVAHQFPGRQHHRALERREVRIVRPALDRAENLGRAADADAGLEVA